MCKYIIYPIFIIICVFLIAIYDSNKTKLIEANEIPSGRYIYKVEYEGHSYIILKNNWSPSGDNFIHSPNCQCLKENK